MNVQYWGKSAKEKAGETKLNYKQEKINYTNTFIYLAIGLYRF